MKIMMMGTCLPNSNAVNNYSSMDSPPIDTSTTATVYPVLCACNGTLYNFIAYHNGAMTQGSWVYSPQLDGATTATACQITLDSTHTYGRDFEHRVRVLAGQLLGFISVPTGTPTIRALRCSIIFESDNPDEQPLMTGYGLNLGSTTSYFCVQGNTYGGATTTESDKTQYIPTTGKIKNLYVKLGTAPGAGKTRTFTLMKNGVATSLVATVSGASAKTGNDTDPTHAVSVIAGDHVSIKAEATASSNVTTVYLGTVFQAETRGETILMGLPTTALGAADPLNPASVEYDSTVGGFPLDAGTTNGLLGIYPSIFKKFYVNLSGSPGATGADGYTFDWIESLPATRVLGTLTLLQNTTSANDTTTSNWTSKLSVNYQATVVEVRVTPVGSPNTVNAKWSCVRQLPADQYADYDLLLKLQPGKNGGRIPMSHKSRFRKRVK